MVLYEKKSCPHLNGRRLLFCKPVSSDGFTFLETILSLALLSILTAIFGMGLVAAVESYAFSRANTELAQKGLAAMQRMERELCELIAIRTINAGPDYLIYERIDNDGSGDPSKIIMGLYFNRAENALQLYTNLGNDVISLPTEEQVEDKLIEGVQSFSLEYFSGNTAWDTSDRLDQLSTIRIRLTLSRSSTPTQSHLFSALVHLRNTGNAGGAVVYP